MSAKTYSARDPFAFSLGGMASINAYAFVPAIADNVLTSAPESAPNEDPPSRGTRIRRFEDLLARYFAPGCCETA
ncbi:MAG: hypothetical protein AAGF72_01045 [Pseudomonadota bacterium]